jgi:hypothetical protein
VGHELQIYRLSQWALSGSSGAGRGGKGIVFLCQDTVVQCRIAIKLIKEEVLDATPLMKAMSNKDALRIRNSDRYSYKQTGRLISDGNKTNHREPISDYG